MQLIMEIINVHNKATTDFGKMYLNVRSATIDNNSSIIPCYRYEKSMPELEIVSLGYRHGNAEVHNIIKSQIEYKKLTIGCMYSFYNTESGNVYLKFLDGKSIIRSKSISLINVDKYKFSSGINESTGLGKFKTVEPHTAKDEYFNLSLENDICSYELYKLSEKIKMYLPSTIKFEISEEILKIGLL